MYLLFIQNSPNCVLSFFLLFGRVSRHLRHIFHDLFWRLAFLLCFLRVLFLLLTVFLKHECVLFFVLVNGLVLFLEEFNNPFDRFKLLISLFELLHRDLVMVRLQPDRYLFGQLFHVRVHCFFAHHVAHYTFHESVHLFILLVLSQEVLELTHELHQELFRVTHVSNLL